MIYWYFTSLIVFKLLFYVFNLMSSSKASRSSFCLFQWLLYKMWLFTSLSVSLPFGPLLCDLGTTTPEFMPLLLTQGHWALCGLWGQLWMSCISLPVLAPPSCSLQVQPSQPWNKWALSGYGVCSHISIRGRVWK